MKLRTPIVKAATNARSAIDSAAMQLYDVAQKAMDEAGTESAFKNAEEVATLLKSSALQLLHLSETLNKTILKLAEFVTPNGN